MEWEFRTGRPVQYSLLLFIFLVSITGCQNIQRFDDSSDQAFYVIQAATQDQNSASSSGTIRFRIFYFDYNIILIDSIPEIYYHGKRFYCKTGAEPNNQMPFFYHFTPDDFHPVEKVPDLMHVILSDSVIPQRVYLISNTDTIRDAKYFELKARFAQCNIKTSTRFITEEEEEIMKSILNNTIYRPENINWNHTLYVPDDFNSEIEISIDR